MSITSKNMLVLTGLMLIVQSGVTRADEATRTSKTSPRPNLVLVFVDDLGYGDIGPFGNTVHRTPNLDRLAAQGRKFTSFYATPVCSMSRACLMTGCYNVRVSVPGVLFPGNTSGLNPDEVTLAEIARSAGYATTCIGKWHLGHREPFLPTKQGFDSWFGIPYSNDMTLDTQFATFAPDCVFRQGMNAEKAREQAIRHEVPLMRGDVVVEYPADQSTLTKRYTDEAIRFIHQHRNEPFFLYLPHSMVHVPLAASEEFRGKSRNGLFGDAVEEVDWSVGRIMETLAELHLDEQTLVIFTSDNGAASGTSAPWRGRKGTVYEGGVREPCLMRWTGKIPPGTTCDRMAGNIDVLPTVANLLKIAVPADRVIDGRDIASLMFDSDPKPVRETQLYFNGAGRLAAIRHQNLKLLLPQLGPQSQKNSRSPKKASGQDAKPETKNGRKAKAEPPQLELYDLSADPAEQRNLAVKQPDDVERLRLLAESLDREIREHQRPAGEIR